MASADSPVADRASSPRDVDSRRKENGCSESEATGPSSPAPRRSPRPQAGLMAELRRKNCEIARLAGTLAHWREWAAEMHDCYTEGDQEASRPARRIYVGGLPAETKEGDLYTFFDRTLNDIGAVISDAPPVTRCRVYEDRNYAFLEFNSFEEASNCMALDGISYRGCYLRIRRPNNYIPDLAALLGPSTPNPMLDLRRHNIVRTVVLDSPFKLFIGGLPCDWSEDQVKGLLEPFGAVRAFNLVMDKVTGNSKGYAFAELADLQRTESVVMHLNGRPFGGKTLTVKRAVVPVAMGPFIPHGPYHSMY